MVEGLTYIEDSQSRSLLVQYFALQFFKAHAAFHRGVEQWQLVGLITRRSGVRIPSPLPTHLKALQPEGLFHFTPLRARSKQASPPGAGQWRPGEPGRQRLPYSQFMTSMPDWLEPMAATLTQERFVAPEWVFERKLDGIRMLAFKRGPEVRLLSRNRLPQNQAYPGVEAAVAALPVGDAILDGEATGVWGHAGETLYHLFDVPWWDGRDLTASPLTERRALLESLPLQQPLMLVERIGGEAPWEHACRMGWEGVIAKREDSRYQHKRSRDWLKMKREATQELVVGGFTEPKGSRAGLGAMLVGYFEGADFFFAGRVGTGFTTRMLVELRRRLDELEVSASPFTVATGLPRGAHWVRPEVVVQVGFIEWTGHGKMRHPRLLGIRTDKVASGVTRESP